MSNEVVASAKSEMSIKDWIITYLILSVPLVGFIMMFVWAFDSSTNDTKKTWSKAMLIWMAISFAVLIAFYAIIFVFALVVGGMGY